MTVHYPRTVPTLTELDETITTPAQNIWEIAKQLYNVQFAILGAIILVANETVEMRVTIDGEVYTPTAGTALAFAGNLMTQISTLRTVGVTLNKFAQEAASTSILRQYNSGKQCDWITGKSVLIEARKTTAAGASNIQVVGYYRQYTE